MAPRRSRAPRPGDAGVERGSGVALGGTALAGVSTGSVTAVFPLRLHRGDPHDLLFLATEAQFGSVEQPVDDIIASGPAIIDELGFAVLPDHEQRRGPAPSVGRRKLGEGLPAVVEAAQRPPRRLAPESPQLNSNPQTAHQLHYHTLNT